MIRTQNVIFTVSVKVLRKVLLYAFPEHGFQIPGEAFRFKLLLLPAGFLRIR